MDKTSSENPGNSSATDGSGDYVVQSNFKQHGVNTSGEILTIHSKVDFEN